MKKINNKGLTIIELLVCFVIVAVISITLLNIIMDYRSYQETENIKNIIRSYKNTMTKTIQSDIIAHGLKSVSIDNSKMNVGELTINLEFMDPIDTQTENTKQLKIVAKGTENYIQYPDTVKTIDNTYKNQIVKYDLPSTTKIYAKKNINDNTNSSNYEEKTTKNDIYFILEEPTINNGVFYLNIPIEHSEINSTYAITIVAPILN